MSDLSEGTNWKLRRIIFSCFLWVVLFLNFDTGVIPAAAFKIKQELKVDYKELAALGTFVNLGIVFGCLTSPIIFRKMKIKYVLLIALVINAFTCIVFAISWKLWALYLTRILMGVTQAFWIVYATIWVNSFAPPTSSATWIGLLQGISPIGIIVGYAVTSIIMNLSHQHDSAWRISVVVQGLGQLLPLPFLITLSNDEIDILRSKHIHQQGDFGDIDISNLSHFASEIKVAAFYSETLE